MSHYSHILRAMLALALTWLSFSTLAVTQVTASVDKNPAMADESIILTVTADGDADRNGFDPSPLLADFVVGRTSVSSQTQIINGNTTRSTSWSTILVPRKPGNFSIPAFEINGQSSAPFFVRVLPVSASQAAKRRDIYVTAEVDANQVYLQQQVKYTVKLHIAQDLQRGSLAEPVLENAEIRQIGKDKEYTDILNGQRFRIIERVFAIIPQQSGEYTINGPLFEGEVLDNTRQSFGFFNRTKTVRRVGPSVQINVLPIPAGVNNHWLPSEYVQLNEEWQPANGQYKVGEPITRTLTLTAVGLVEEQLPEIASQYPDSVKTYPDQADTVTVDRDDTLIAQRIENIAIIPNQAGLIALPEVSVPWFNISTRQTEYATLPARTIEVVAAAPTSVSGLPDLSMPDRDTIAHTPDVNVQTLPLSGNGSWWSISSWILLFCWLLTVFLWFISRRGSSSNQKSAEVDTSEHNAWQALNRAIGTQDPKSVYPALSHWLAIVSGDSNRALPSSQRILNDEKLDQAIANMFTNQYGADNTGWKADELLQCLAKLRDRHQKKTDKGIELTPLYPST